MTETGIWSQEEANTGHLFSYRLAQWIANYIEKRHGILHGANEVLYDFGCGKGTYCKYFEDRGFNNVIGVEGNQLEDFENSYTKIQDLSVPFLIEDGDSNIQQGYVISIEVGEHIPKQFEEIFINNIVNHAAKNSIIFMSWAHEGQQGYGHVNCQPDWYVKQAFERKGCKLEPELTAAVRKVPEGHTAYLRENLFIFRKL